MEKQVFKHSEISAKLESNGLVDGLILADYLESAEEILPEEARNHANIMQMATLMVLVGPDEEDEGLEALPSN